MCKSGDGEASMHAFTPCSLLLTVDLMCLAAFHPWQLDFPATSELKEIPFPLCCFYQGILSESKIRKMALCFLKSYFDACYSLALRGLLQVHMLRFDW